MLPTVMLALRSSEPVLTIRRAIVDVQVSGEPATKLTYVVNDGPEIDADGLDADGHAVIDATPSLGENRLEVRAYGAGAAYSSESVSFTYGQIAAAGAAHSGVIRGGRVYVWGRNTNGQAGTGADVNADQLTPFLLDTPRDAAWISFAQNQSLVIQRDGSVWTFGQNADGQLGQATPEAPTVAATYPTPTRIPSITDAVSASMGLRHALVLLADGSVVGFGLNAMGQLGDGTTASRNHPVAVQGLSDIIKLAAGSETSFALDRSGTVWAWGRNQFGNLGQGVVDTQPHPLPAPVPGLADIVDIAAGRDHLLAVRADGLVFGWGLCASAQCGNGIDGSAPVPTPIQVAGLVDATAVWASGNFSLARTADGALWGWGQNFNGQLGQGVDGPNAGNGGGHPNTVIPTRAVEELEGVISLAPGATHVIAVRRDGRVFAWGWSFRGTLGRSDVRSQWSYAAPVEVDFETAAVEEGEARPGGLTSVDNRSAQAFNQPAANLVFDRRTPFVTGKELFRMQWLPRVDPGEGGARGGLGPLFHENSCVACHQGNGRGAPAREGEAPISLLVRIGTPADPDPVYGDQLQPRGIDGVPAEGRVVVSYLERRGQYADGEAYTLYEPLVDVVDLAYGPLHPDARLSARIAQPMIGLGLLEAVPDSALDALLRRNREAGRGIDGRTNRVWSVRHQAFRTGRFGWKANQPDLEQQNAAAFLGDLGVTSPLFPTEPCTPSQTACLAARHGGAPELSRSELDAITFFSRFVAVPARVGVDDPVVLRGKALFHRIECSTCHNPTFTTAEVAGTPELSGQTIWPYTDLLLHDMGDDLADGRPDFDATGREWRTPPLWGIGLTATVGGTARFLHDGRARSIAEAILWHGGEAESAREAFRSLPRSDRQALLAFVENL
ncbi:di-heme oxidoredictase family protein [Vulgatibacter incomptus]|uniref:di-heme oxidoredictase family protein n=1 Tax=Vulgatibacter incomptus TaxID=1391653 RepID=UPI001969E948|nr:di-heme oxidoredictase family protein [Vulgatibacter incomptus]